MKKHPFRKRWGQNFLQDPNIIRKIVNQLNINSNDKIIEIGPGQGALTLQLTQKAKEVNAIEIDPLLVEYLKKLNSKNLNIIEHDILNFDLSKYSQNIKVIGNLPYNITSPIIFKFLNWNGWSKMVFMTQKELAERIVSNHGNKTYGRISVMAQALSDVQLAFTVPKTVFFPQPDVTSAILIFKKNNTKIENINHFTLLVKKAFSQRRKTLRNSLKGFIDDEKLGIHSNKRAEELSVQNYIELSLIK